MAKKNTEVELWERREGETNKQFEAFCVYRDLGIDRTQRKVSEQLRKSEALISRWASINNWTERVRAYDDEQDRLNRIAQQKEIAQMRKRHAGIASKMLETAQAALEVIDPLDVKPNDISRLVEVASKLERISRGDVGDVVEEREGVPATDPVQIYIPDNNRGRDKRDFDDLEV